MNDPKRWLEEGGGASFDERELLRAGQGAGLSRAARRRIWFGVAASAASIGAVGEAAGAIGGSAASQGALSALASSALAKGVIAIAIVGGATAGVAALRTSRTTGDRALTAIVAPATPTVSLREPRPGHLDERSEIALPPAEWASDPSVATGEAPAREVVPSRSANATSPSRVSNGSKTTGVRRAPPRPAQVAVSPKEDDVRPADPPESRAASHLREESAAILAAREALLAGRTTDALRQLDRARAEFPGGALAEEREALKVRALIAAGDRAAARERGETFLRTFPKSPHASEIRALLGL